MVYTGANKPADAEMTGMAAAVASAMAVAAAPTAITKLVMKTGLNGSKKKVRYLRFVVKSTWSGAAYLHIAELTFWGNDQ